MIESLTLTCLAVCFFGLFPFALLAFAVGFTHHD